MTTMVGLLVRMATVEDAPAVHALMRHSFPHASAEIWTREDLAQAFIKGDSYVLERSGDLIGYCLISCVLDEAEILSISIQKDLRGKGMASLILSRVLSDLSLNHVSSVYLEVRESNVSAHNLYLKHGFVSVGKRKAYYVTVNESRENAIMYKCNV